MKPPKSNSYPLDPCDPGNLEHFFSQKHQSRYVAKLLGRGGITRRRAEYFVRLWAYLLLKQTQDLAPQTLETLVNLRPTDGLVSCTHREAAELFYGQRERGSDRAAGMMIDQLAALGLLEKRFDGQTLCLGIRPLPELISSERPETPSVLLPDQFNPRTDAIPVANLIRQTYAMAADDSAISLQRIARILRQWSQDYPVGIRVLRRADNLNPVGVAILYPTMSQSEEVFSRPPGKSFFLTSNVAVDPVEMAQVGDKSCLAVYLRAWLIDMNYLKPQHICAFQKDTQNALRRMQADFPNLCDLYSPVIHPLYEELRTLLGFQRTCEEHRPFYWIYLALDRYLDLDIDKALVNLSLSSVSKT
ncbi:hypothetical protein JOY44_16585 [Phormidium sp. CLA17]|uniref:hypothetical protein n=1 Tax=Leptolyngbya sp. Cla-17 TaxID=2803751 RepID=UPI0014929EF9|nr:hypothetical protein [Leptolyngbya sp. Cla-17]MBM0743207.1 hypothetical protein [Leptolyngbya sp. Cla-17]